MSFADNLVYLRQHYGITQEGLAEQFKRVAPDRQEMGD